MTASELEDALALAGLRAPVHWHEVTGSTNAVAVALAESGAPEWSLVGAGHQTEGRGRLGRTWQDRAGSALMVSLVLRPDLRPDRLGLLTLLAGAAWAEAANLVAGLDVRCKWPNDLLLDGRKVGGVLAESSVSGDVVRWVVVGSGVNLAPPDVEGAGGLGDVDRVRLLGEYLSGVRRGSAAGALAQGIVDRWTAISATLGRQVSAVSTDGARRHGTAVEVDGSGRLVLDTENGRVVIASDDVEHLR